MDLLFRSESRRLPKGALILENQRESIRKWLLHRQNQRLHNITREENSQKIIADIPASTREFLTIIHKMPRKKTKAKKRRR